MLRWGSVDVAGPAVRATMEAHAGHMAPNGSLHAGRVVTLADTAVGSGCMLALPEDGPGFTTLELTANVVGTLREGLLTCGARRIHGGRTTEVCKAEDTAGRPHDRPVPVHAAHPPGRSPGA